MQHYGLNRIRKSLVHFLIGKGMTAISSIGFILLLANLLSKADYAALVTVQALILVAGVLLSFGVNQSLIRFVPELRAVNNNAALYHFVNGSVASRIVILAFGMAALGALAPQIAPFLRIDALTDLLWLYMVVGWFRVLNLFFVRVLEALLWQKISQYGLAVGSILKLSVALLISVRLVQGEKLALIDVFYIELLAEAVTFSVFIAGYFVQKSRDPDRLKGEVSWISENMGRIRRYGFWAFLNSLTMIAWGSGPNRLVAAKLLPAEMVATYGFADALASLAKRLMPATMLHGMIRPILVARFSTDGKFSNVAEQGNLNFRINLAVLGIPILVIAVGGHWLFNWVTGGNYPDAGPLLAAMIGVAVLDGFRMQTEMACDIVELNDRSLLGNLVLALSLLLAIALVPVLGVWGMVAASFAGEVAAILLMLFLLSRAGHKWSRDGNSMLLVLYLVGALGLGVVVGDVSWGSSFSAVVASVVLFLAMVAVRPPISADEKLLFGKLVRR